MSGVFYKIFYLYFTTILLISPQITQAQVISVVRTTRKPDSFKISKGLNTTCSPYACVLLHGVVSSASEDFCDCECSPPFYTFYTKLGGCVMDSEILQDNENRCNISLKKYKPFPSAPGSSISVHYLYRRKALVLSDYHNRSCSKYSVKWSYFKNSTWIASNDDVFRLRHRRRRRNKIPQLLIVKAPTLNVDGLLIKVHITCSRPSGPKQTGCLLMKSEGTYNIMLPVTTFTVIPPVTTLPTTQSTTTTKQITTKQITSESTKPFTTETPVVPSQSLPPPLTAGWSPPAPTTELPSPTTVSSTTAVQGMPDSHGLGDNTWIAIIAGVVAVLVALLVGIALFCLLRMRKRRSKKGGRRHHGDPDTVPMHEYEYVQYPALGQKNQPATNHQQQPDQGLYAACNVSGNPMYEIGPSNQLIIHTPGVSMSSLASKSNISISDSCPSDGNPSAPAWLASYNKHKQASRSTLDSNEDYVGRDSSHESVKARRSEYQDLLAKEPDNEGGYTKLRGKTDSKKNGAGYQTLVRDDEKVDQSGYVDMETIRDSRQPREQSAAYEEMSSQEDLEREGQADDEYLTVLPNSPVGGRVDVPETPPYFVLEAPDSQTQNVGKEHTC